MKKFFKFAAIAAIAAAFVGCNKTDDPVDEGKDPGTTTPTYTEDIAFTLEEKEVEEDKAKFGVEHNGTKTDTWYYFATTSTDIQAAIEAEVAALISANKMGDLENAIKKNVTVRDLEPETAYTFVVFAVKADGTLYGEPATASFTTTAVPEPEPEPEPTPNPDEYTVNPAWTVTYIGDYEEGGKVYNHVITVETTDTNPYFVTAWPVEAFDQVGIATVVEEEIKAWEELLAQYPGATWADNILYTESILATVGIDPAYGTKWYAMAIGCDTNGKATGLYALSEVIDLENLGGGEEEEPTAEYAAWLGSWTFTGSNGVAFDVTMSKGKVNQTYKLSGWEGPESEGLDITVNWMAEDGIWVIFAQNFGTYNFGGGTQGDIWLTPNDGKYIYPEEGVPACLGGFDENGNRLAIGYSEETADGVVQMAYMLYIADIEGQFYTVTSTKEWPLFPITITPATKAAQQSVKEFKGGKKTFNALAPYTFKTFELGSMNFRTL